MRLLPYIASEMWGPKLWGFVLFTVLQKLDSEFEALPYADNYN